MTELWTLLRTDSSWERNYHITSEREPTSISVIRKYVLYVCVTHYFVHPIHGVYLCVTYYSICVCVCVTFYPLHSIHGSLV